MLQDWGWRLGPSCHLIADTQEELHAFARRIGLKRSWFQIPRTALHVPHYDLTARRRAVAVTRGALELATRDAFVGKVRELRAKGWP